MGGWTEKCILEYKYDREREKERIKERLAKWNYTICYSPISNSNISVKSH